MKISPKENLNHIDLVEKSEGRTRRHQIVEDILDKSTLLPKTVVYEDIDEDFRRWVDGELEIISDEGRKFPTFMLFSNQRFSEYSQSWEYTDKNNNLELNFKTVSRENNPKYGKIQAGIWNIPGDRFYRMKRMVVLDDNGSESYLDLKMKQPLAVDLNYKLSIFTTKYEKINEFNILINKKFSSCQCYIRPNNHYMPMKLDNISDESQYNIDDRQFYGQTYTIVVNGYIIEENDFRIDESPLKIGANFSGFGRIIRRKPEVEINECDKEEGNGYIYDPLVLTIDFTKCNNTSTFKIDTDFELISVENENLLKRFRIFRNDEEIEDISKISLKENDDVKIIVRRKIPTKDAKLILNGYNPNSVIKKEDYENEI